MMMGNASTSEKDFVSRCVLDCLIFLNEIGAVHTLMIESEIDINGCACLVDLRDTERYPYSFRSEALSRCFIKQSQSYALAHI